MVPSPVHVSRFRDSTPPPDLALRGRIGVTADFFKAELAPRAWTTAGQPRELVFIRVVDDRDLAPVDVADVYG